MTSAHPNLLGRPSKALEREIAPLGLEPYRARQIYAALHRRNATSFAEMTDLPLSARAELEAHFSLARPSIQQQQTSADGTTKFLFRLEDRASVEAVDIPEASRRTLCVSSQAGCALACRFCVTGFWGAGRNLTSSEIVGQVYAICEHSAIDDASLNLVFMGMGEPLLNLEAVHESLSVLTERVGWRRITVSTAGIVPGIDEMSSWEDRPNLAISLHAPDDERRSALMPINRKYPLADLFASLRRYPATRHRPITFEYTLINGVNDRIEDAASLVRLLSGLHAKVNLIPLNPDPVLGDLEPTPLDRAEALRREIVGRGLRCSLRRPRGDDVAAACGQLRAFAREPRGFPSSGRQITA